MRVIMVAMLLVAAATSRAATYELVPDTLMVDDRGYSAEVTLGESRFIVQTAMWPDMYGFSAYPPDSITLYVNVLPRPGEHLEPNAVLRVRDRELMVPAAAAPDGVYDSFVFLANIPRDVYEQAELIIRSVAPDSTTDESYLVSLKHYVGTTPPPINLAGLELLTSNSISETDSTYIVELRCQLVNLGEDDRVFSAVAQPRYVWFYPEESKAAEWGRTHGAESILPFPWASASTSGTTEAEWDLNGRVDLPPGGSLSGSYRLVYRKVEEMKMYGPGELQATIEVLCRNLGDEEIYYRTRTLARQVRIPLPE